MYISSKVLGKCQNILAMILKEDQMFAGFIHPSTKEVFIKWIEDCHLEKDVEDFFEGKDWRKLSALHLGVYCWDSGMDNEEVIEILRILGGDLL